MIPGATEKEGRFRSTQDLLEEGVRRKAYGAAVLLAARGEEIACHTAAGEARLSSVFDIASLTKPMVAALFFVLSQEGKLALEDQIPEVLTGRAANPAVRHIRLVHLLAHTSGLSAYRPFYADVLEAERKEGRRLWGTSEAHDRILDAVLSLPLDAAPETACVYSDLGYMLLGRVLEAASGKPLDRLLQAALAGPLQMRDTCYLPLGALSECETGRLVPTGYSEARGREKLGEVDDENAAAMGGVAGHAGIFSTAYDLFLFAREILRARRGEGSVLSRQSALKMTTKVPSPPGVSRTPGWDTPTSIPRGGLPPETDSPLNRGGSQAGKYFPPGSSIGHLGYTGCSLWIDLPREATIVLLTNRLLYRKQNDGLKSLRPLIHDAVIEELLP